MALPLHTLDVFTDRRFTGNPLAVVLEADDLSTEQMQAVGRELNLSETVFVLKPQNPAHSARVRIFTPERELPFAGHPTIGTAILLAQLRTTPVNGEQDAIIVLEQSIGTVRIGVRLRADQPPFAEFDAPKLPVAAATPPARDRIADALGLFPPSPGRASSPVIGKVYFPARPSAASISIRASACTAARRSTLACSPRNSACRRTRRPGRRRSASPAWCTTSTGFRTVHTAGSSSRGTKWVAPARSH
jgi:PhzF family phenazine biosynthesis protein